MTPAAFNPNRARAGGILLHPTSLPGPYGIGDLGLAAERWLDWLVEADCRLWQVLPLGPTGYGDSPYQCFSAFAGNPLLISLEHLVEDGLLTPADLEACPTFPAEHVDFGAVLAHRSYVLHLASDRFRDGSGSHLKPEVEQFRHEQAAWLEDFALFMALKDEHRGAPWTQWEPPLVAREARALTEARARLGPAVEDHCLRQFLFFRQWRRLRTRARDCGLTVIGDIPIFVAHDSADVWSHPHLFYLDASGRPTVVAGVPPDYFSPTGQLWGNPLYRWDRMRQDGYAWWVQRFKNVLQMADLVRLDHFRGFEAYWEVPADAPTAEQGRWVPGPGADFLEAMHRALGGLPIIAEDLGEITPGVIELRDRFGLPGMKILQFSFECDPEHEFLPHNYPARCVVYTGTHDNDTAVGWYQSASEEQRDFCRRYLASDGRDIAWDMIRAAWSSVAEMAIVPMQDLLGLGTEARMNYPSRPDGNWTWRLTPGQPTPELAARLRELNFLYARGRPPPSKPNYPAAEA
ncbi:MAG: 4-alpha-glucanotransferase [Chloroflexota bacterium]